MPLFTEHAHCSSIYCALCLRRELAALLAGGARSAYPRKLELFVQRRGKWRAGDPRRHDATHDFFVHLLTRRRLVTSQLIEAPDAYVAARLGVAYDRFAYEQLRPRIIRSVRKAIDDLLRRPGTTLVPSGRLLGTTAHHAVAPGRLFQRDGRFDAAALEAAVNCEVLRSGAATRNRLAQAIVERWDLAQGALKASLPSNRASPEAALHAHETTAALAAGLGSEERLALADELAGRTLAATAATLRCSVATAHRHRHAARRLVRKAFESAGIERPEMKDILFTLGDHS